MLEGALLISGNLRIGVSVIDAHGAVTDCISGELATVASYAEPAATLLGVLDQVRSRVRQPVRQSVSQLISTYDH